MNNFDEQITTEEEAFTKYLDGGMSADARAEYERDHPEAMAERKDLERMQQMLRVHGASPHMRNAHFFNHQILREIAESKREGRATRPERERRLPLWRLILAGACCLLGAFGVYQMIPDARPVAPPYVAEIISVETGSPELKARLIQEEGITVVMLEGLDDLQEDFIFD